MSNRDLWRVAAAVALGLAGCDGTIGGTTDAADARLDGPARADGSLRPDATTGPDAVGPDASAPDVGPIATDATSDDATPPDAPPPGPGCAGRSYLLCEDFESAPVGGLPSGWTINTGWHAGNPSVASDEHHSGARALHSAVASSGQSRALATFGAALSATARGQHWGRVFYKVRAPAFVPTSGVVHNTILALMGAGELRVVDTVVNTSGVHQFLLNIPDDTCCVGSRYDYRSYDGAWHCAEWHIDQSAQSYRFFYDGTEVTDIAFPQSPTETRHPIEAFTGVALGWRNYQEAATPYESWLDDLAIDATRVGCE